MTTILTIILHRRYYDTKKISSISIIVTLQYHDIRNSTARGKVLEGENYDNLLKYAAHEECFVKSVLYSKDL